MAKDRITVQEAARRLGVKDDAIRKRLQRGTLEHEKGPDGRVYVFLDATRDTPGAASHGALVDALRDQVAHLKGIIETRDRELETRAEEIRRRDIIISSLTQPPASSQDVPDAPETAPETSDGTTNLPADAASLQTGGNEPATANPGWWEIVLAVLLAGAIPIVLTLILARATYEGEIFFSSTLLSYLLVIVFHLFPLPFGIWAGLAWPGRHLKGHILLGLAAGLVELVLDWGFTISFTFFSKPLTYFDILLVIATVALFISGGLFGDLIERWRSPHGERESELVREIADKVSGPGKEPSKTTLLLIQSLGPSFLALIGTIITSVVVPLGFPQ